MALSLLLFAIGLIVLATSLMAGFVSNRSWVSEVTVCLAFGAALGPLLGFIAQAELLGGDRYRTMEEVARITVGIAVMGTALRLPPDYLRKRWRDVAIVLGLGMPLMWLTSAGLAMLVLGVGLYPALLVGGIVAPTDPVVAASIVTGRSARDMVPARVRNLISAESAANDGLGQLFVMLGILLLTEPGGRVAGDWLTRVVLWQVGGAIVAGAAIGWLAGRLFVWAKSKSYSEDEALLTIGLALSLTVLAGLELIHADGILAVFVAGVMFNAGIGELETQQHRLHGAITRFLDLPAFVLIGVLLPWHQWQALGWAGIGFAVAVLVVRRLPWWLALAPTIGALKRRDEVLFAGWFGPIGAAAAYYALLGRRMTGLAMLWPVVSLVIALSVVVHGISATPITRLLAARRGEVDDAGGTA